MQYVNRETYDSARSNTVPTSDNGRVTTHKALTYFKERQRERARENERNATEQASRDPSCNSLPHGGARRCRTLCVSDPLSPSSSLRRGNSSPSVSGFQFASVSDMRVGRRPSPAPPAPPALPSSSSSASSGSLGRKDCPVCWASCQAISRMASRSLC